MNKKYNFKFRFDLGSGGCLWPNDNETRKYFDLPADEINSFLGDKEEDRLHITNETLEMIEQLDKEMFDDFNDNFDFYHVGNIDDEKEKSFQKKAKVIYDRLLNEIGNTSEIKWCFGKSWMDEYI